jgi:hypothetical protein
MDDSNLLNARPIAFNPRFDQLSHRSMFQNDDLMFEMDRSEVLNARPIAFNPRFDQLSRRSIFQNDD